MAIAAAAVWDRTFNALVAEGQALIPRLAPPWTDHNVHDPGITLIELFAWLTEMNLYRLGRTPDSSIRAFLRLFGVSPRAAGIAETILTFSLPGGDAATLPAGLQVVDRRGIATFQTIEPLRVSPARLVSVLGGREGEVSDATEANTDRARRYRPFGSERGAGGALYLGFDRPLEGAVTLYVWTGAADHDRELRTAIAAEWASSHEELNAVCSPEREPRLRPWQQHYGVDTVWEYRTAFGAWEALAEVRDETRALTISGLVRFVVPSAHAAGGLQAGRYFIRCRIVRGTFDCAPEIAHIALNAAYARHEADVPEAFAGRSRGRAGELFSIARGPVVFESARPRVVLNGTADATWRAVSVWDGIGPHDRALLLSADPPLLTAGNGRAGRVPPANADIWMSYRVGGGPSGNLSAHSLDGLIDAVGARPAIRVEQPFAATGGTVAETLTDARARLAALLASPARAVTLDDYETLAMATPGVPVARARAVAEHHPDWPCLPASGCVTLVIVPSCAEQNPEPGPGMLAEVRRYVGRRRTLTAELHVAPPRYVRIAVHARLHLEGRASAAARRTIAAHAGETVNAFFHPVTGGPRRTGWAIGRAAYRAEILALLNGLEGVSYVDGMGFMVGDETRLRCGSVHICPDSLIAPGSHRIEAVEGSATS